MARFRGSVGYSKTVEKTPGVWVGEIVEREYTGDVIKNTRRWSNSGKLNDDILINNQISIIADPFALLNFYQIRFVRWMGVKWKVSNIEIQRPRLILTLGDVYNES